MSEGDHRSFWLDVSPTHPRPELRSSQKVDVAVVGGGITGMTTALRLVREGYEVALLDQSTIGSGTTGHTTAKVTSQHGATYAELRKKHGQDGAAAYASANERAKDWIAGLVESEEIDCDLRRREAHLYAASAEERRTIEDETTAAIEAGLPADLVEDAPLPFETYGSLRFVDQAEFHPQKYLLALADLFEGGGGTIYENTRAVGVDDGDPVTIATNTGGELKARHVVVATLIPFLDRGFWFARAFGMRSYVITATYDGPRQEGMSINPGSTSRSIRSVPDGDRELLMIGGEGHSVGSSEAQPERYDRLAEFARRHWDIGEIVHRWSAQDFEAADSVPFVGPINPISKRILVATGMRKWGITNGTVAAEILTDHIAGRETPDGELFSSLRLKPLAEGPRFLKENSRVPFHMVGDRIRDRPDRSIEELGPGEGDIVKKDGRKVAGYRDEGGDLHAVSTRCTHLGCQVRWNAAESTWDCPCHASRFSVDGEVLNGPAVDPLPPR